MAAVTKLLLTEVVTGLGAPGHIVKAAADYGRNCLRPASC